MARIFLAWSGEPSKRVAIALREWIPKVLQAAEPWMSDTDLPAGSKWESEISGRLKESVVGIVCLTAGNLKEPWIHFEAGALSHAMEPANVRVVPYLYDLKFADLAPPLSQFNAATADEVGTRKVVETINSQLGAVALDAKRLAEAFQVWWPKLQETLVDIRKTTGAQPKTKRDERELLEEILGMIRALSHQNAVLVDNLVQDKFWSARARAAQNLRKLDKESESKAGTPTVQDFIQAILDEASKRSSMGISSQERVGNPTVETSPPPKPG